MSFSNRINDVLGVKMQDEYHTSKLNTLQPQLPSVSMSTARFWKMSMWDEWAIVAIPGVWPLLCIYCIAWVPTYSTRAFIRGILYFIPGVLDTCQPTQIITNTFWDFRQISMTASRVFPQLNKIKLMTILLCSLTLKADFRSHDFLTDQCLCNYSLKLFTFITTFWD